MKWALTFTTFICLISFAFADLVGPDPFTGFTGGLLLIAGINFIWNYLILWLSVKITRRGNLLAMGTNNVFGCVGIITVMGLFIDIVAFFIAQMLLSSQQINFYNTSLFVPAAIMYFIISGILLFIVNFVILKTTLKNSAKESAISALFLALLANPAIIVVLGVATFAYIIPILIIIWIFLHVTNKESESQSEDERKITKKDSGIISLIIFAGIVLLAISLFIPGSHPGPQTHTKDAIANTLVTYKAGGSGTSPNFVIKKGEILSSADYADKGFDSHSVLLAVDDSLSDSLFNVSSGTDITKIQYLGSTNFNTKAQVYCQVNGTALTNVVNDANLKFKGIDLPGICKNETYSPCCLVIIKNANSN